MTKAAVLTATGQPLEIRDDVEVEAPRAGEVKVRLGASGVCHSDLSMQNGTMFPRMPIVLGHEGAGVVEQVGEGVTSVAPGDHVVISWVPQCGECFFCTHHQGYLCERASVTLASGGLLDGTTRFTCGRRAALPDGGVGHLLRGHHRPRDRHGEDRQRRPAHGRRPHRLRRPDRRRRGHEHRRHPARATPWR